MICWWYNEEKTKRIGNQKIQVFCFANNELGVLLIYKMSIGTKWFLRPLLVLTCCFSDSIFMHCAQQYVAHILCCFFFSWHEAFKIITDSTSQLRKQVIANKHSETLTKYKIEQVRYCTTPSKSNRVFYEWIIPFTEIPHVSFCQE